MFVIKKVKISEKTNQKELRREKVITRKGNKLCVKWKGYDSCFNSWIDKKDIKTYWISSRTKIFKKKSESWIRFILLCSKIRLKNATGVFASKFAKKFDLPSLKSEVDNRYWKVRKSTNWFKQFEQ